MTPVPRIEGRRRRSATAGGLAIGVLVLLAAACAGSGSGTPPVLDAVHEPGFGELRFTGVDGVRLRALTYRATGFDPVDGRIWFVMHGASRDVERYIRTAAPVAERHDVLAVAIEFPKRLYPRSSDYTLGVHVTNEPSRRSNAIGDDPGQYLYSDLERLFDAIVAELGGRQTAYSVFGHSAGAQFTHRLLTFLPHPRVDVAVAANAGWYTLPLAEQPGRDSFPYGLLGSPVEPEEVRGLLAAPLVVLVGEADTTTAETDDLVRGTPEAEAQGSTRRARGEFYFESGRHRAATLDTEFDWQLAEVPHAGHDAALMIDSAAWFLFDGGGPGCEASGADEANGLMITEILADPPDGPDGDANGDGARDPQEDEFVELVNAGDSPLCLAGWTLGDANDPLRHVFPLGTVLAPGAVLVVFGGGIPTGDFDGAVVQWCERSLGLSNAGDILTLRDATGRVVCQFSWGDADDATPADDHWPGDLGLAASLVRPAAPGASWQRHPLVEGRHYSPGRAGPVSATGVTP